MTFLVRTVFLVMMFAATCLNASGIEEIVILVSPDGDSRVILVACNHDRLPEGQTEELAQAIALMQDKDPGTWEVVIEKPASVFTQINPRERITTDLETALNRLGVPRVSTVDGEIRNVAILAYWLFDMKNPWLPTDLKIETGPRSCDASKATLGDLCDEFQFLHNSLSEFSKQLPGSLRRSTLDALEISKNQMNGFLRQIARYSMREHTLLQCANNLASYDSLHPEECERERIRDSIFQPFSQLFNLNLVQQVYDARSNKIILAGSLHTDAVKNLLLNAGWLNERTLEDSKPIVDFDLMARDSTPSPLITGSGFMSETRKWLHRSLLFLL